MGKADHQERKLLWLREQFDPAFQGGVPTRGVKIAGNPCVPWHLFTCSPSRLRHVRLASAILRHPARQVLAFFLTARQFGGLSHAMT
jgi:hypothetical protein